MVDVGWAQTTGRISGQVTDAQTGDPLPGVNVLVVGTERGAATNENGRYSLIGIEAGTYSVRASFVGYGTMTVTDVRVTVDHNTEVDFELQPEAIQADEVVVRAQQEVVKMDMSASSVSIEAADIEAVPQVKDLEEFINLQGGVQGMSVRGGSLDEVSFMVDGLTMVDNRAATPMTNMVNLSAVKTAEVIKGGFNAEYGNVRSGVVSVVTKEGSPDGYSGTIDLRAQPPRIKHSGEPLYSHNNYYMRPYLDPEVMWEGTDQWPEEVQDQYPSFIGWNAVSERLMNDDDPNNDMTPEQARDKYMYLHAVEGSEELGQKPNYYGDLWDWRVDGSIGGPVPVIGSYLGDLTFFLSHRTNKEEFGLPVSMDYFTEHSTQAKLTSRIMPGLKVTAHIMSGQTQSVVRSPRGTRSINDYNKSAEEIFHTRFVNAGTEHYSLYNPGGMNQAFIYMNTQGLNIDHTLGQSSIYKLRLTRNHIQNDVGRHQGYRDKTEQVCFGDQCVDAMAPYGLDVGTPYSGQDDFNYAGTHGDPTDSSSVETYNIKFDLTSQLDAYNVAKTGFEINYDRIHTRIKDIREYVSSVTTENWQSTPYQVAAYVQDKFEWEGMIANVGIRADYSSPNTNWYFLEDPYSEYYSAAFRDNFTEVVPRSETEGQLAISPRLGVSHPVTSVSKLYFNYGHFYSLPQANDRFRIFHGSARSRLNFLGNPNLEMPRTVAYELGYEQQIRDQYLIAISGYYKNVTDQVAYIDYTNFDASVDYTTTENNNYADIRGFELQFEKSAGRWFTGWANYNYMVRTAGYVGREHYYQDQRLQRLQGLQNPYQEKPLARPYARANLRFHTPLDWGPEIMGRQLLGGWNFSFLYKYQAGSHFTWDPLDTNELQDNVQWAPYHNWDLRVSKNINTGGFNLRLFADVQNLFNQKHLNRGSFAQGGDWEEYMRSLHLPMYEGERYQAEGLTAGDDRPGDVKSDDEPYIDMPNRKFLWYLDERFVEFGAQISF
jgi:replicative DNA helicase